MLEKSIPTARLLQSCCFHLQNKNKKIDLFQQHFPYITYRFPKNVKVLELHRVWSVFVPRFPTFFVWSRSPFLLVRSSRWAEGIKVQLSLSRWMWVERETGLSTFPAVFLCLWHICCGIPTINQAWFWPDRELSLRVNLIYRLTIPPQGNACLALALPQSTYINICTI